MVLDREKWWRFSRRVSAVIGATFTVLTILSVPTGEGSAVANAMAYTCAATQRLGVEFCAAQMEMAGEAARVAAPLAGKSPETEGN